MNALLFRLFAAIVVFLSVAAPASAHQTGASTFIAHVKPEVRQVDLMIALPGRDIADELGFDFDEDGEITPNEMAVHFDRIVDYVDERITLTNDGDACNVIERKSSHPQVSTAEFWHLKAFECEGPLGVLKFGNTVMLDSAQSYSHMGKIQVGERIETTIFNREFQKYTLNVSGPSQGLLEVVKRYVWQGLVHIVLGPDHVLFVILLILMTVGIKRMFLVVTSFTVAHSITLGASALGAVDVSAGVIEPLIALSIAYVAVEALVRKEEPKFLYIVTFIFGLIHGFGFSYVLRDEVGLPTDALVPALGSFNIGVELGQIGIVLLLFPLRRWIHGKPWEKHIVRAIAGVSLAIAIWWFAERTFF